jgi:hypothetical protein
LPHQHFLRGSVSSSFSTVNGVFRIPCILYLIGAALSVSIVFDVTVNQLNIQPILGYPTCVLDMASGFYRVGVRFMAFNEFQQYFSYIMAVSFISGEKRSTRRKPSTCHNSLMNISDQYLYQMP